MTVAYAKKRVRHPKRPLTEQERALAAEWRRYALGIVKHKFSRLGFDKMAELNDVAMHALCLATQRYDPTRSASFKTYLGHCVWTMCNQERRRKLERHWKMRSGDVLASQSAKDTPSRIPHPLVNDPDPEVRRGEMQHLLAVLDVLPPRYRELVEKCYGFDGNGGMNFRELGKHYGCSYQRIHQLHAKAIQKLRAAMKVVVEKAS